MKELLALQNTLWTKCRRDGASKVKKKKSEEEDKEETTLAKDDDKAKEKAKCSGKTKDGKSKKKETRMCNHCGVKGHIEEKCWKKAPSQMPEEFRKKKTEKAGAAVEEEHYPSIDC